MFYGACSLKLFYNFKVNEGLFALQYKDTTQFALFKPFYWNHCIRREQKVTEEEVFDSRKDECDPTHSLRPVSCQS